MFSILVSEVIHYVHTILVNNTAPEVARDFLLLFYFSLGGFFFFPFYPKALGGYFHHVDWLICLCSSSIQCMLPMPGV